MENISNLVQDKIWNHTVYGLLDHEKADPEKDEISSQVIKKVENLVSRQITNQIRFKVWRPVMGQVKKINFRLLNRYSPRNTKH
jgi:hypothetical protein